MKRAMVQFHFLTPVTLGGRTALKSFITALFRREGGQLASLSYIFCSDEYLLGINQQFLQHDDYTDIITFDLSEPGAATSGEIYISIDRVRENAAGLGLSFKEELHRVIFHGALHLCGYKDKSPKAQKQMRAAEDKYLSLYFGK
jgi:probable rRNA maturation factor